MVVLSKFENGFDAKAAGFQKVYGKTQGFMNDLYKKPLVAFKKEIDKLDASYKLLKLLDYYDCTRLYRFELYSHTS